MRTTLKLLCTQAKSGVFCNLKKKTFLSFLLKSRFKIKENPILKYVIVQTTHASVYDASLAVPTRHLFKAGPQHRRTIFGSDVMTGRSAIAPIIPGSGFLVRST